MADFGQSPPPGGDEDRGHSLLVVCSIFAIVVKNLGLDDLFITLGAVSV